MATITDLPASPATPPLAGPTPPEAPAVEAPPKPSPLLIPTFIFAHLAHHLGTGALAPLLPLIRQTFSLDYTRSSMLLSSYGLALGIAQLPVSALADRFSKRMMIAIGLLGVGVVGVTISATTSFWQLVPLLAVMGVLAATYHAPASAYLAGAFGAVARGRALGLHVIGGAVAFSAAPVIAVVVVNATGSWRMAFLALSLTPLVAGIMMLVTTWRQEETRRVSKAEQEGQGSALAALRAIGPLVGIALAEQLLTASMFAFIPLFMVDRHGMSANSAGLTIAIVTGVGIFAAPLGGALSDRFGRAPVLVAATASVGPLILLFTYAPYGLPIFLVLVLYGISMNTRMPVLESLFADAVPAHRRATVLGMYYFIGMESSSLTTPLVGWLMDSMGQVPTFTALGVIGTVLSLGLFLWRGQLLAPRLAAR